jgi:hypothetical protein
MSVLPHLAEGVYLPHYGIVFTATVTWGGKNPVTSAATPAPKVLSQWEQIRKELRGETIKSPDRKGVRTEPSLADTVLKVMSENGRHFSQLREDENLTVVLTLHSQQMCMQCHTAGASMRINPNNKHASAEALLGKVGRGASVDVGEIRRWFGEVQTPTADDNKPADKDLQTQRVEATNFTRLGEMRQKQGRTQEAIDAYQKALEIYHKLLTAQQHSQKDEKSFGEDKDTAYNTVLKLARSYMELGQSERAYSTLKESVAQWTFRKAASAAPKAVSPSSVVLPGKLIISAPKRLLDQVGTGKVGFDDFKKAATVQFLSFPAPESGSSKDSEKGPSSKPGSTP